jgi:signal transduction histidine kinase/CheY-like chemotaxis protein
MTIKQSTINTIAGIASFLMALLLGGSVYFAGVAIQEHNKAVAQQAELKQLGIDLADASDYLTDEARKFAVTGNIKHLQNYWKEIEVTKTRDHILVHLKELKAPLEEFEQLKLAKQNSDALVAIETRSMRLVLEAQGLPKSSMHPAVAAWQLSAEDIKLSAEDKMKFARKIMFDAQYEAHRHIIMEPIAQFQSLMNARTAREVQAAQRQTQTATFVLVIMVFLILIDMGIVLWVFKTQLILPVAKYINDLQKRKVTAVDFALTPAGTQELRLLAEAFNQQFHLNQQQLKEKQQLIEDIVQVSQGLAEGNLQVLPKAEYQGDFAPIKNALETTLSIQQQVIEDIVKLSQGLADGNLHIMPKAEYRGDFLQIKTAIETTLTCLLQVIEDIVRVSQGLAEGQLHVMPDTEYRGDFVQIKKALESAAALMAKTTAKNAEQNWLKTGQTQLNDQLSGEQEVLQLAENTINFMTPYLEAQIGALYLFQENPKPGYLKMMASHAYTWRKKVSNEFKLGEGLVGQVALERKMIIITEPPVDYIYIQSGLGRSTPRTILVTPFLYENTLKGIIELASFKVFTEVQIEFINQVMPTIAIAINSAQSRQQMQELLQQTQAQSEELQRQTEELQTQQAALQQTNEELQSQSEELQTQQEELRHANEELEKRTSDLEQQKEAIREKNIALEKSQQAIETKAKELELASQYKSEFLANMSHELRTPLNSLLILAQLLKGNTEGNLTDKQVEYARTIHSTGNDLLTLINEILDLSKVEAGKIEVHLEDMPLAALVETVEQKFRHVAQKKELAFNITVADDLPPVLQTDAQRLKQIINNLLSNAFKFTDKGEIKLDIKLKSPQSLAFSVADTGVGIPKEKQHVIFEAFQQADGSTSRRYGGTGLGLSISRQLARLLGGELQLDSEEGKGSTFTLYLPLDDGQKPELRENKNPVLSSTASQESRNQEVSTNLVSQDDTTHEKIADDRDNLQPSDKSILIIEDDRQFSSILMQLAQERGFKCLIAEDGKTGLLLAEEYQPHAIILDVRLPQLDGWSVMERLKDNPQTRHIPVHFMSASDLTRDAKKMGAIGYSLKPINMAELSEAFKKIQQFISKSLKKILLVVDNEPRFKEILDIVGSGKVQTTLAETVAQANEYLNKTPFDCIVVDIDVENSSGIELLKQLYQEDNLSQIPVILYALRELTTAENQALQQCETHLTVKAVKSRERLLDETTLFLHQVEANLPQDKRNMLHKVHDKEAILKNKKVLIVDDDMRNTFALATVLEDKQMEVVVAENGKEALKLLEKQPDINIVLMDIMMPEMDGYKAMQKMRAQERLNKLPIIALTAKAMKGDKTKCIEAGANDYLSKPVDTDKLISLMRVWLYQ